MAIKAVIFDLDGTLVDFAIDFKAIRAEAVQYLIRQGLPPSILSVKESIFETLKKAEIYLRNEGRDAEDVAKIKQGALSIANRHELEAARRAALISGVLETLKALKNMGITVALFTVNSRRPTAYILQRFRIRGFFETTVTRECVPAVKPDPTHLEAVFGAIGVKPEESMVVGDDVRDMRCAREAKAIAVGVATGLSSPARLARAGASYLVSSLTDLPTLIQQINSPSP